ncbi:MAG: NPCBM-associated, NEW3 domain of alpha-galactosidase [Candidatus Methanofastidiosum methylothiophilum]|uniref:NPCBM-associated, NEW3 domain of alpha-galactosidase n=1 Tax=Candidatus Methanofastidiosum methylothiophilum TaxID=1705564 RepID=A0A150J5Y6_9EURY|nr:MAG: NPCBM-associated, NEW3 domain of alpha-galactosidase [Candidatus Methanofastidiosum methylthiophilus]
MEAVFPLSNYHINSISYVGHTPLVSNNSPTDFVWRYGDYFATNTQARILMNVTKKCTDQGGMNANLYWDGLCNKDGTYDRECQDDDPQNPLVLSGNVCLMKVPELLWATTDKAQWKLCLTNAGSGASYNVWLEDVIGAGLSYNSSSGTYSQLYINQDRNGNPSNGATWIIDKINAGDKTEVIFTANIDSCTNLTNTASTSAGCLGSNCQQNIKTASSTINIPGSAAQTTNRLPAFIDMCKQEPIKVIVKNSGLTTIYNVNVTVTKPNELVYVPGTGIPNDAENISASPLRWTKLQAPALAELDPGESVNVSFQVKSSCNIPQSGSVSSQSFFGTPCGTISQSQASTSNINTRSPIITIAKTGRNVTKGQVEYGNPVVAESGDTIEWKIDITNNGAAEAELVQFWDDQPPNMTYQSISPTPSGGGSGTSLNPWIHGTLAASTTTTYYVTATVNNTCLLTSNQTAYVKWGCDDSCIADVENVVVVLRTDPELSLGQTLCNFTTCSGYIEIRVTNAANRPTARNVQVTSVLPAGFVYDYNLTAPGPNTPVNPTQPTWNLGDITAGQTKNIIFMVKDNGTACGTATQVTNTVSAIFFNSCGDQRSAVPSTWNVTPQKPNLTVDKSPAVQVVGVGGLASWTITVRNTGNTNANNVTVIDILDPNWNLSTIVASNGSNGEVPSIVGDTITWNISNPISGPSGTWTATLSANLINAAGTGRNDVYVRGRCPSGCTYSSGTDSATILNLEGIAKTSRKETATIGEEVIFDIAVNYHGVGSVYRDTSILDTLPGGLSYVSHTFNETNASIPHPYTQAGQSINWMLGSPSGLPGRTFTGPNSVQIALTTKIRDIPGNVNGVTLINPVNTTFVQDGNPGNFSDSDDVQIVEPNLIISKDINGTTSMQALPGQSIHYRIVVTNNGTSPAFEVYIRDQVPNGLILNVGSITSTPNANSLSVSGNDIEWYYNSIVNGDSVTLEYDAVVPPRGGLFINNANVPQNGYSSMPGPVDGERYYGPLSDDTQLTTPGTDLTKVTLNTEANIPSPGGVVYYRLTIENSGALPLDPVQLIDTLPDGLTYITGSADINTSPMSDPAIVQNPNGSETLTWANLNSLLATPQLDMPVGQFIIVEFQARVDPGRIGTFINEATVIGTVRNLGDVTDTDDSPVGVKKPAISIIKSVQPPYGKVGFENQFTLKVTNTGEVPLNPVLVEDILPIGLTYADSANIAPDSVVVNGDGTTKIVWNNIGALAVGESRLVIFSAKFNGLENLSINRTSTEGWPPNGDSVTDDDQVQILKKSGGEPREIIRITTKGYMKRCDLCYDQELLKEARELITNQNVLDEDDTCCRPDDIIEELQIEIVKNNLDNDPRYLSALKLLDDADELCREANEAFEKGNYSLAQKLTKDKCQAIGEAIRLMIEVLSSKF